MEMEIKVEQLVNASSPQVYQAFTRSTALRGWMCDVALADARPSGRLYFGWHVGYYANGEFTELAEDEYVAFTWHGRNEPGTTQVKVALAAKDDGTQLTLTHGGIGSGDEWAGTAEQYEREWKRALENLKSVLETGQDQRYVLRPMLGIMVGEFNAEVAKELGVPVDEGIRLDGVVEGMGAEACGLQQNDVIVGIAGAEVTTFPTLTTALDPHRAGDKVEVVFYRGDEKKQVTMELSRRPLPEVPPTPEGLADAVRRACEEGDAALDELFAGVSEKESSFKPAPDEWSAKETMAHLIIGERGFQDWLASLINDDEIWHDRFENPTTVPARLKALLTVYPTVPELLEEFKRSEAETVAMLAALPDEFVARKRAYVRLGYALLELPGYHTCQHLDQIREAVKAAQGA
jgi:uncharacterized protein YndB with AHSA1/START domain